MRSEAVAVENNVPMYQGFPLYPPEEIEKLTEEQPREVIFPLRAREGTLREFKVINQQLEKEVFLGLKLPEGSSFEGNPSLARLYEVEREMKKSAEAIRKEFKEAEEYLVTRAEKTGWKIKERGMFKDGGSSLFIFEKVGSPSTVKVIIYSGMIGFGSDGIFVAPFDYWGKISYEFR